MHIVFVIAPAGGPEANVKTLAPELEKRGHHISVIYTVAKDKTNTDWSDSIRFRFAPPGSAHYYAAKFVGSYHAWPLRLRAWQQASAVRRVLNEIEAEEPIDIVEVTEGFPVSTFPSRWRAVVRAQGSAWTVRQFCEGGEAKNDRWLVAQQRRQFLDAHAVTALSAHLAGHLREALQLSSPVIEVIPYGIDTSGFKPSTNGLQSGPPILLAVGRLERRKGTDLLLRAMPGVWQRFPDARVHLIGNEAEFTRSDLLAMVPEEKRNQIVFPGFLERDQLIAEYQHATIYVAPTQYETFGYTVLEAMACGKPVISTRVGAIPELVDDGETGLLVEWNDPIALADAVLDLLANPANAARMGRAGRDKATTLFSVDAIVERSLDSYQRALAPNSP
jgi:glycosyltransferase involved in cell wall biosynthesis